jgi:hypothetical protein
MRAFAKARIGWIVVAAVAGITWSVAALRREPRRSTAAAISGDEVLPRLVERGRHVFRHETFGSEAPWGSALELHRVIAGREGGGTGAGLSPRRALALGLKIDTGALPPQVVTDLRRGRVDLDDPATTLGLLRARALVGLSGRFDAAGGLRWVGVQCALCHSTVDDETAPAMGGRLDGWPNRDLDVGALLAMAPNLSSFARLLQRSESELRALLSSWGPGRYDTALVRDGKAHRPDGRAGATLIPATFGLAGVSALGYTGSMGPAHFDALSVFDLPLARDDDDARGGSPSRLSGSLAALHTYLITLQPPTPPRGSYDELAAARGKVVFRGAGRCTTCHVPPLFVEPTSPMHTGREIGIADFGAGRSPPARYRTAPLRGLFTRARGGYYHDGRFPTLADVVEHYDRVKALGLSTRQKRNLVEYLKSL